MRRETDQDKNIEQSNVDQEETSGEKRPKYSEHLEIEDLGAGYNCEDKRVARAIKLFETKLLPYVKENSSLFKHSNFIALKGYATGISSSSAD